MRNLFDIKLLFVILAFTACGEDRTYEYMELTEETHWIFSKMKESYLWGDSIKNPQTKDFFADNKVFYKNLLMKYDKSSYFEDSASLTSYGMSFAVMRDPIGIKPSNSYALVLYVEPNSPAHVAGIKRGTWISKVGGSNITTSKYNMLERGKATTLYTNRIDVDDEGNYFWHEADSVEIDAACELSTTSMYLDTVYNIQDTNVGYMVCNRFIDGVSKSEFADVLSRFNASDVSEIIIDLRYNSGGPLREAVDCASLFVPSSYASEDVCAILNNKGDSVTLSFGNETSLSDAEKIYILTTEATRGAAEIYAIALQRTLGSSVVKVLGMPTAGESLITEPFTSPYGFNINPVTAQVYLADGSAVASDELRIDYQVDELSNIHSCHPLGSRQEYLLYNTLYHIVYGSLPMDKDDAAETAVKKYIPSEKPYSL